MELSSVHLRAKAPLRVSFAGGGTDVAPFPAEEGGLVLSATIDRYAYGSLTPRADQDITVESVDLGITFTVGVTQSLDPDGKLDLVKAAISRLGNRYAGGYDLFLRSSVPPGSGLGSSSTLMVALVGLLRDHHRLPLTDYEVAHIAYQMEREDLGILGGMQDHYAATFGGFNFIEFHADQVVVNPLRIRRDTVDELEHNLLLAFTGKTRESSQIIEDQTARLNARNDDTLEGLRMQKQLAVDMKNALLRGELDSFGDLLNVAWEHKKMMSPKISNGQIDDAYAIARNNGALGGKVTGAGGGGYILLYCEFKKRHRVAEALQDAGLPVIEIGFTSRGLTTWSSRSD